MCSVFELGTDLHSQCANTADEHEPSLCKILVRRRTMAPQKPCRSKSTDSLRDMTTYLKDVTVKVLLVSGGECRGPGTRAIYAPSTKAMELKGRQRFVCKLRITIPDSYPLPQDTVSDMLPLMKCCSITRAIVRLLRSSKLSSTSSPSNSLSERSMSRF
ncbi:hypothetical protein SDJN03_08769, partial [Cucurbita argyrosperma subsp. sororia]